MDKEPLLKSTRFWTAIAGVAAIVLVQAAGMSEEQAQEITNAILVLVPVFIISRTYRNTAAK
jgi:hypothetical protein